MKQTGLGIILAILILASTSSAQSNTTLVFGNPSQAGASDPNNLLVVHKGFVISYNRGRGVPNWVAWHLTASDIGDTERSDFITDPMLPVDSRIKKSDYNGSGFDRGHMCPSKDRSDTEENNRECFVMSNIQPQTKRLNEVTWKHLEDYTRDVVKSGNEAYIYAGCYGTKKWIKGKVAVPNRCFKIIVFLPEGKDDLRRITTTSRIVAVDMPNDDRTESDWTVYQSGTSIDKIEAATKYDFLSRLPKSLQRALERVETKENR
jgi:endonuclease G